MGKPKMITDHKWVTNNHGSIAIRFMSKGTRYNFNPVTNGKYDNINDRLEAIAIATRIETDIKLGKFTSIDEYKPKPVNPILPKQVAPSLEAIPTIAKIWMQYTAVKSNITELTSQKTKWKCTEKIVKLLGELPYSELTAVSAVSHLLKTYQSTTIRIGLTYLHSACELAIEAGLIDKNPIKGYKKHLPKVENHRRKSGFPDNEVEAIIDAFKSDIYVKTSSRYRHSYYAEFVEMLFLTGLRPQALVALRWEDIKTKKDGSRYFLIDRAVTYSILKQGKNNRPVKFPIYPQLSELLERIPRRSEDLIFPSFTGGFINTNNFTKRYWGTVLHGLVQDGEIDKYYPTYHCRHTAATRMIKNGVPLYVVGAILDTSSPMLAKHYVDDDELISNISLDSLY